MKIGAFITITRPGERGDTYNECLDMAVGCFDLVNVVDGKDTWPQEFSWPIIGQHFQAGYNELDTDWVIHLDTDFIFHEQDFEKIRQVLGAHPQVPALSFYKYQFILPDRYNLKSRLVLAVNKKKYGDRITFSGSGDLCQPQLDGKDVDLNDIPQAGVPFYNYEKLTKSKKQIMDDVGRMDRAYQRHFGKWLYSKDGTDESAYEGWLEMAVGRFHKPQKHIKLKEHPIYIQETIKNLTPEQWGYSMFGIQENDYVKG